MLLPEWARLWRRVPAATPFQSPDWLTAWWRQFGTAAPRVLVIRSGNDLIGVLPLYELVEPGARKLLPIGIGLSDYIDALIDLAIPDVADRLLGAIADIPEWDECHLPDLPPGSALAAARCPPGFAETSAGTAPCPVLALPRNLDDLAAVVPRKTLRDVHQGRTRSARLGDTVIERVDTDALEVAMENLFRLHERRWRRRGEDGVCADPLVQAFHRDAARALAKAGMLRLYRLSIGGRLAAVYYGFCCNGRAYAYLGGFDPEMTRLSPGAQILHHAICQAIAEGCREFHFLRGGEAYKYGWGAIDRVNRARTLRRT